METVLIVGATGNIGTSAVMAALRSKRNVLAIVRNQNSANKLFKNVGSSEGITTVVADVMSDTGVKGVVDQVRAGKLPAFQHVWSSVGGEYVGIPLTEITTDRLRNDFNAFFESNFFAYHSTIPYLISQGLPNSSFSLCVGAQGDTGFYPIPAMTQGALFSMSVAAARECEKTNVRFNEVYLSLRVENDEDAIAHKVMKASEFGKVYELILKDEEVKSGRVWVESEEDLEKIRWQKKF